MVSNPLILVLNPLAHPLDNMAISVKKGHRSHHSSNTSQNGQRVMRPEIAVHRNRSNSHRSRDHVTTESHEAEGRSSVHLVHEDDVEVCAGEEKSRTKKIFSRAPKRILASGRDLGRKP